MIKQNSLDRFGARSAYLAREWLVAIQVPAHGAQPVIEALSRNVPMIQGRYDQRLFVTGAGQQRFHARAGAHPGFADAAHSASAVEISFSIPQDQELLERVFETVFVVHCDEEPTIRIMETWGSRADDLTRRNGTLRSGERADARPRHVRAAAAVYACNA